MSLFRRLFMFPLFPCLRCQTDACFWFRPAAQLPDRAVMGENATHPAWVLGPFVAIILPLAMDRACYSYSSYRCAA